MTRAAASADWELSRHVEFWRQQLAGIAPLELPTDRQRPVVRSAETSTYDIDVPSHLPAAVGELARRYEATSHEVLVAAVQALFTRYSGQDDIAVGTLSPRSGHTVVLRSRVEARASFGELVAQVKETVRDAFGHDGVSLAQLVDALAPQQDTSVTPFVQAMVVVREESGALPAPFDPLDLSLEFAGPAERPTARIRFSTALFDEPTVARLAGHLGVLLAGAAADPRRAIPALPMLTDSEYDQVVREWNATDREVPTGTFPELFATHVASRPDAVAVIDEHGTVTYRELDERANRLAHHLRGLGAGRDVLVGLCVERGAPMAVGLLGIMKAGAAYLPLDADYPPGRLAYMLQDSGARLVVTQRGLRDRLPHTDAVLVTVDQDPEPADSDRYPLSAPDVEMSPQDLAYVIYTSGSTGKPKGVLVSHAGIGNLAAVQTEHFDVTPDSRILQFASASFDAAFWEICMGLVTGAALVMGSKDAMLPGEPLAAYAVEHQ
ncbi:MULTISPECIES: AMP-binding protein [Streptomyces]|uniref:AMP-binding protein n=1 Tax=Streptomyces pratisoli TaxID=3139917 RepID=A0ACC6QPJ7_9ACTN|nr:AMP-binding protein [Streptomyces sp. NBC_00259]